MGVALIGVQAYCGTCHKPVMRTTVNEIAKPISLQGHLRHGIIFVPIWEASMSDGTRKEYLGDRAGNALADAFPKD